MASSSSAVRGASSGEVALGPVLPAAAAVLAEPLPDLAMPSDLADLADPCLRDPMLEDGNVDLEKRRQLLFRQVSSMGEIAVGGCGVLKDDWSNIFEHNLACNVVFDIGTIWAGARNKDDVTTLCEQWFERLVSEESDTWFLESSAELQKRWPAQALWPRCLAEVWEFLGETFSLSSHVVAQCYEDNFLSLLRKDFRVSENNGEASFSVARWTLLVAISGAGKSTLMSRVEEHLKSPAVRDSFELAGPAELASLKGYDWYSAQGANLEGFLTLASKCNDPVGLRFLLEEVSLTVSRLTERRTDRLSPEDVIRLCNPSMSTGKRLKSTASEVHDLKVVMTAGVQGGFAHLFLPFSPEGESYRWTPVVSPPSKGLDTSRADKLTGKSASQRFLCELLSVHVIKNLGVMPSGARLVLDRESSACANAIENAAKRSLKGYQERKGMEAAQADPVFSLFRGKLDGQYMHHLVSCWLLGESLLAWLNPSYRPKLRSTGVYARMALKRCLLGEGDRRCLMLTCRRHIESDARLRAIGSGADPEKVEELMSKRARLALSSAPRNDVEKSSYVLQKVLALARVVDDVPHVITPDVVFAMAKDDALVRRAIANHTQLCGLFDRLSSQHRVVEAFGVSTFQQPQVPLLWRAIGRGDRIERVRPLGRPGGQAGCPAVRLVSPDDASFVTLLDSLSRDWAAR